MQIGGLSHSSRSLYPTQVPRWNRTFLIVPMWDSVANTMCELSEEKNDPCYFLYTCKKSKQPEEAFMKPRNSSLGIRSQLDCTNLHNNQTVRCFCFRSVSRKEVPRTFYLISKWLLCPLKCFYPINNSANNITMK